MFSKVKIDSLEPQTILYSLMKPLHFHHTVLLFIIHNLFPSIYYSPSSFVAMKFGWAPNPLVLSSPFSFRFLSYLVHNYHLTSVTSVWQEPTETVVMNVSIGSVKTRIHLGPSCRLWRPNRTTIWSRNGNQESYRISIKGPL